MRTTPQAIPVAPAPGGRLLEHDDVASLSEPARAKLPGEMKSGGEAVHAGPDDHVARAAWQIHDDLLGTGVRAMVPYRA